MTDTNKTETQLTEALKVSEERYRLLTESMHDAMVIHQAGKIRYANPVAARTFGVKNSKSLVGKSVFDFVHPDHLKHIKERIRKVLETGQPSSVSEQRLLRPDGSTIDAVMAGSAITYQGAPAIQVVICDKTSVRQAEDELKQSDIRFRQLAENIREVFWITEPDKNRMIYISPAYEAIWGRSCKSLYASPRDWIEAIHADDRKRVLIAATTKQISGEYDEEYRIVRPDGTIRWIHDRAFPVPDESGKVCRIVGVANDITEIAQARLLDKLRQRLMETILNTKTSLSDMLTYMTLEVEKNIPGMLGSVLLLDEEGCHLHHGAAPSLPDAYNEAINGVEIGPCVGSCGTAAFRAERVIVSDIATDPLWENYKDLALSHGLAACWSEPVQDESGKVLGTFAMYYRKRRAPQPFELKIVELMSELDSHCPQADRDRTATARCTHYRQARSHYCAWPHHWQGRLPDRPGHATCL
jgi:PAS domain S-box-containing protein